MKRTSRYDFFLLIVLVYNLGVILWGAYVRATGSGAGCGSHWPLCNGEVIPLTMQVETLIEFSHRLTSGLAFVLVLVMLIWTLKVFKKGHPARIGAILSMIFMITEALVGAGLVLFEWVADDVSTGRVISISVHLLNTFFLLGSITLTIWWSRTGEFTHIPKLSVTFWVFLVGLLAVIVLGVSGAITALGDTLFPSESLVEGIRQDFSSTSHFLVRLRVWHPVIAIFTGTYLFLLGLLSALFYPERKARFFSISLIILYGVQLCAGLVNLLLQAPVWMQLVHLLLADLVWIGLVLLTASVFAADEKTKAQSDHVTMLKTFERHAGESL